MRKAVLPAPLGPPPFSGHTLMTDPGLPEASPGWTSKIALASELCRRGLSFSLLPGQNWPDAKTRRAVHPFGPQSGDHNVICRSDARRLYQPRRWDLDAVLH